MEVMPAVTGLAAHASGHGTGGADCPNCGTVLGPHDFVGQSFFIAQNMMLAFAGFFFSQVSVVPKKWQTSVSVAFLVCFIAWYNYTFMKDIWVQYQVTPTVYRYSDWLITVPLQVMEFYFILKAANPRIGGGLLGKLFGYSFVMLVGGWLGETGATSHIIGFVAGMAGWLAIVYEVFSGEAAGYATALTSAGSKQGYSTIRTIVTFGWTIYPLGYFVSYIAPRGITPAEVDVYLNVLYNIADLVNKGMFGCAVWAAAKADEMEEKLLEN